MTSHFPFNLDDLVRQRTVEFGRVKYKATWDENTRPAILETISAFANDVHNLNGGYIVIGIAEEEGVPRLPPRGLDPVAMQTIQDQLHGDCQSGIEPAYHPICFPELLDGKHVLVVWCPGSDNRPHQARNHRRSGQRDYFIRQNNRTVVAKHTALQDLLAQASKSPFDVRRNQVQATIADLREATVREFLHEVRSGLIEEPDAQLVYRKMQLLWRVNGHEIPRNIGLLFFSDDADHWFPGARIEVVHFADGTGGNVLEERVFRGPLQRQVRDCLSYLHGLTAHHITKTTRPETSGWLGYPAQALDEAIVNAIYHRSYDGNPEPTKVYFYPDRLEISSYPGPVPGITLEHLAAGAAAPAVPARNRRIGELLKELHLAEGRGTGIPKIHRSMRQNGSPAPRFDFDEARTYFRVILPAHPEYLAISILRDVAHLKATGQIQAATERLRSAVDALPASSTLTAMFVKELAEQGDLEAARAVHNRFVEGHPHHRVGVTSAMITAYLDANPPEVGQAARLLDTLPTILSAADACELAILERRAGRETRAHELFVKAGDAILADVKALHEFAQTKIALARTISLSRKASHLEKDTKRRLNREAAELLQRVVQMEAPALRRAWASFDLARTLEWLRHPPGEIEEAYRTALELAPDEPRFGRGYERWRRKNGR